MRITLRLAVLGAAALAAGRLAGAGEPAADVGRNPVNLAAKNLPTEWGVEEGKLKNVRWSQDTGSRGYGGPVVAGGRVYVATNNKQPRDPKVKGPRAVLMCFEEKTGKFLWQVTHPMPPPEVDQQAKEDGLCSTPTVVGDELFYVTPGCAVICADAATGAQRWSYDLMQKLKVYPCIINSCKPLVVGDLVYVATANGIGVNAQGDPEVLAPKAPSFVALDRKTGDLKWQSNLPGKEILFGQWGSPAYAEVNGKGQVICPGGDNYLYGLDAKSGELVWKFHCNPTKPKGGRKDKLNYLVATPVVHDGKAYVGVGLAPDTGTGDPRDGHFWCIDITKKGDVSPKTTDPKDPANRASALVWYYGGEIKPKPKSGRSIVFGPTLSSPAVHGGLAYLMEETGILHCLDASTGQKYWDHDFKTEAWGSAYWADGRVYVGLGDGTLAVFAHGKEKKLLAENDMLEGILSTPAASNGALYITTKSKIYAIGAK
jgi:outer membrane protein assembly factor BamB